MARAITIADLKKSLEKRIDELKAKIDILEKKEKGELCPEQLDQVAKIIARGTIIVPLKIIKYAVDGETGITLNLVVKTPFNNYIPGPYVYSKDMNVKDLEKLLEMNSVVHGYFRYDPSLQYFNIEKVEIVKNL